MTDKENIFQIYCMQQRKKLNTHILHSVRILLLIEVVVKSSHVGLFEIGLERKWSQRVQCLFYS